MSDERDSFAIERARKAAAFAAKKMRPQLSLSLSLAIAGALAVGGLVLAAHSGAASHALERMHRFADARSSQAAAVSLSSIGHRIFELLCPLFGDCPAEAPLAPQAPSAQPRPAAAPPARAATTTAAVFATETPRPAAPAPSATPARASPPAPSAAQAIIERIVQREADAPAFDARLAALEQSLIIRMNQLAAVRTHQSERAADNVADQISRATTITALDTGVLTGKITNAIDTASAAIASLTATELVATNATTTNLHVSGSASLNGDLTVSGTLTANILNVQGVSSAGALVGPFVTATSSSATSTFAGGFSVAGESILATTTVNGTLTVNGNTYVSEGGQLTVGDKIIAPGEIGLGTSTPAGKLAIQSTDADQTALLIRGASGQASPLLDIFSGSDQSLLHLAANGNVGIGTTSPMHALSVYKDSGTTDSPVAIFMGGGSASDETTIKVGAPINQARLGYNNGSGGPGAYGFLSFDATKALSWNSSGNVGIGTTSPGTNKLYVAGETRTDAHITAGSGLWVRGNRLTMGMDYSGSGAHLGLFSGGSERMTIQSTTGNVGIGTTTPDAKLSVKGDVSGSNVPGVKIFSADASAQSMLAFGDSNGVVKWNTGYRPSTGNYIISSGVNLNSSERLVIDSSGNVGIGTSNPLTQLHLYRANDSNLLLASDTGDSALIDLMEGGADKTFGGGSGGGFRLQYSGADDALYIKSDLAGTVNTRLAIDRDTGNVGIGTTSPARKLDVYGGAASIQTTPSGVSSYSGPGLLVQSTAVVGNFTDFRGLTRKAATLNVVSGWSTASNGPILNVSNAASDGLLYVDSGGNVGIGTTSPTASLSLGLDKRFRIDVSNAYIHTLFARGSYTTSFAQSAGNSRIGSSGGFEFYVNDPATLGQVHMGNNAVVISNTGNVGIGTTSPQSTLAVESGSNSNTATFSYAAGSGELRIVGNAASGQNLLFGSSASQRQGGLIYSNPNNSLSFRTNGVSDRMVIDSSGNVGIGTTGPGAQLHVKASSGEVARFSDELSGDIYLSLGRTALGQLAGKINFNVPARRLDFGNHTNGAVLSIDTINGNVGIGTTNPNDAKVEVKGGTVCVDTDSNDSATSCIASESDERLKTNIQAISASSSLDIINALNPVSFDWRASDPAVLAHWPALGRYAGKEHSIGLIAQEVMPILPEALSLETVGDDEVQYYQLDYTKFVPHLIGAVKELWAKVQDLGQKVAALFKSVEEQNAKIQALEARVNALESQTGAAAAPSSPPPQEPLENGNSDNEDTESQEAPSDEPTVEIESPAENPESESAEEIEGSEAESTPESAVESEPVIENPEPADAPANE